MGNDSRSSSLWGWPRWALPLPEILLIAVLQLTSWAHCSLNDCSEGPTDFTTGGSNLWWWQLMSVAAIVISTIFAAFPLRSRLPEIGLLLWSGFTWSLQFWAFNQDLVDNYDLQLLLYPISESWRAGIIVTASLFLRKSLLKRRLNQTPTALSN
ncbi:hypothetical protein [Corynebacterium pseudodiphtheriticum]|uniref:hypothetical protein n=1 Tax=Corynebacterium pseudodiphtheriticum TaxID=37637 RepID=UPI002543BC0D|nr:hypothetical protein [Corynebacterium pseudodiphtheriticum]MDK4283683.1 hypothetical protein [Corynebacterium pseudodiphtheriticum]MDK8396603.1 hypothetical protein [Corynebacterium pseudodiphtheriticum]